MATNDNRNLRIDALRGFTAIMVVLGHTLQRYTGHDVDILYNIIFSFQMPLFMMISGYVNVYVRDVRNTRDLAGRLRRRVLSILVPWFMWSAIVYIMLGDGSVREYIDYVVFHMEHAYWFLFSLFCIDVSFSVSQYAGYLLTENKSYRLAIQVGAYGVVLFLLLLLGRKVGTSFLGIKYTVYYSIFYILGYAIALLKEDRACDILKAAAGSPLLLLTVFYCFMISRYRVFEMPDTGMSVPLRMAISFSACLLLIEMFEDITDDMIANRLMRPLLVAGAHSLDLYVVHYLVVRLLDTSSFTLATVEGYAICLLHFGLILFTSGMVIRFLGFSRVGRGLLFGRW